MNSSIITQINIESSKVMLNHAFHKKILLLAYDEYHCTLLEKLTPLIAAPWFLGCQLFVKSQWIPTLRIDDIPVVNYEIIPSKNMLKACKYHEKFIKAIYEAVKELQVIVKSQGYSIRVPAWIGLIVNDIVTYNVHSICVDECLDLDDIKIYHNNIKENLIAKQKGILDQLVNSSQTHNFKHENQINTPYNALNVFIELTKFYSTVSESFNIEYYKPLQDTYQDYLGSLKAKWWQVTVVDEDGNIYMHKNKGRLPKNHSKIRYNKILFVD